MFSSPKKQQVSDARPPTGKSSKSLKVVPTTTTTTTTTTTNSTGTYVKRQRTVLDEDDYVNAMEKIIVRDYFPELPKLRTRLQAIQQGENRPNSFMHRSSAPLPSSTASMSTPAATETFRRLQSTPSQYKGTPASRDATPGRTGNMLMPLGVKETVAETAACAFSLDVFHAKFTSQDNNSFADIMVAEETKRKQKNALFLDSEAKHRKLILAADMGSKKDNVLTIYNDNRKNPRPTWDYKVKNDLMYFPETHDPERNPALLPKQIQTQNTRLADNSSSVPTTDSNSESAYSSSSDVENKDLRGYSFVDSSPSVQELEKQMERSPIMTWGQVAATPQRINNTPCREFRILGVRSREELGRKLERQLNLKKRRKSYGSASPLIPKIFTPSPNTSFWKPSPAPITPVEKSPSRRTNKTKSGRSIFSKAKAESTPRSLTTPSITPHSNL